jgi:ribosomal protein L14E/L6E/L27E
VKFLSVTLGQVVISKAGRDAGKRFVVTRIIDDLYVAISDGDLRKIEKPKKKKIKHLELTGEVVNILEEKLTKNVRISNSEIRKILIGAIRIVLI